MGMTMTQKILAAHAGLESVVAGQLIEADLDLVLGNDITSPVAIHEIEKMKEVVSKLKELGIDKIEFDETFDFTSKKYYSFGDKNGNTTSRGQNASAGF